MDGMGRDGDQQRGGCHQDRSELHSGSNERGKTMKESVKSVFDDKEGLDMEELTERDGRAFAIYHFYTAPA
jgi:hypothetical protein